MTTVHLDDTAEELLADWLACFRLENPGPWAARQRLTYDCAVHIFAEGADIDILPRVVAELGHLERQYEDGA